MTFVRIAAILTSIIGVTCFTSGLVVWMWWHAVTLLKIGGTALAVFAFIYFWMYLLDTDTTPAAEAETK